MDDVWVILVIIGAIAVSVFSSKIDAPGGLAGGGITYLLYLSIGWFGIVLMGFFFALGTAASLWKLRSKQEMGLAEDHNGRRGWPHVIANSGVSGLLALAAWLAPAYQATGSLLIAACFAAALSDTWSSELGNVYGTNYYHLLTGQRGTRGRDGVVSAEGSLAGVAGSGVMAVLYGLFFGFNGATLIVLAAGVVGNLTDSVLGATLERRGILGNHAVNFLSTVTAALVAYFLLKNCSISV